MKTLRHSLAPIVVMSALLLAVHGATPKETPPAKVAYLGVTIESIDDTLRNQLKLGRGAGVRIQRVMDDSPAQEADLRSHDVLVKLNDQLVFNGQQLSALVRSLATGDKVSLEIIRQGERRTIEATLGETEWKEPDPDVGPDGTVRIWNLGKEAPHLETWLHRDIEKSVKEEGGKPVTFLGVELAPVDSALAAQLGLEEEGAGALVRLVLEGSPAEKAGLKAHDVISRIDAKPVKNPTELTDRIREHKKGDRLVIGVLRAGKAMELEATLSERATGKPTGMRKLPREFRAVPGGRVLQGGPGDEEVVVHLDGEEGDGDKRIERRVIVRQGGSAGNPGRGVASDEASRSTTVTTEQKMIMIRNDDGVTTTVKEENGNRHVTVEDAKGKVIFDGPANSEEEKQKLPAGVRERIEKIQKRVGSGADAGGDDLIRELRLMPRHYVDSAI